MHLSAKTQEGRDFRGNILLNGTKQSDVLELDTEEGWLVRCVRDENGQLVIEGDSLKTERLTGVVTIDETTPPLTPKGDHHEQR
jgi:hypothetical protein